MSNNFSTFLSANKVLLLGLLAAIGTVVSQFVQSGPVNYPVMAWAIVVAGIGFLANNLHGQIATILSSLLPTIGVIYESTKDNTAISWGHVAALAAVAIIGAITGPAKPNSTMKAIFIICLVSFGTLKKTSAQQFRMPKEEYDGYKVTRSYLPPSHTDHLNLNSTVVSRRESPFKPEHKVIENRYLHTAGSQKDSLYNTWRFTANISAYNYTFGGSPTSSSLSGMEYGYEHQRWNVINGSWDVIWSINAAWFPINTALPVTLANIQTFGVTFGFKNPIPVGNSVIQVGPDFNLHAPKNQQWGLLATIGILLN